MKRIFVVLTLLAAVLGTSRLAAQQDPATAAAEREQAEERHRSIVKSIERIEESVAAFQKNVTALRDEVRHMKDELDRFKNKNEGAATQENIKRLAEKIEEVDRKRLADNERTVKYIDARNAELQKLILERPTGGSRGPVTPSPGPGSERVRPTAGNPGGVPEKGFEYKIKSGDRLQKIVAALKAQGFKATEKQIMDANPTVDWSRLKIDQKIFIPDSR
jgi:hypothetical protein